MDIISAFLIIFAFLIYSIYKGIFIIYPLLLGLLIFILISARKGYPVKDILGMALKGGKKSLLILRIFVLIGAIISVWMAGGTIPFIVYYGIHLINPNYFILSAFIISGVISFILGTSFGTVGTIGIALMVLAKSGNVNIDAVAGAVIAGAYFGDRCSPMSSSANLVAGLTNTDLYRNIRNMNVTSIIPVILSIALYTYISFRNPLAHEGDRIVSEIEKLFNLNIAVVIPAVIILVFALLKINVQFSMLISIIAAVITGVFLQQQTLTEMVKVAVFGYDMQQQSFLNSIIHGGGILSMAKTALIVFISSAYSGIFEGTGMLKELEGLLSRLSRKYGLFPATIFVSILTSCFGCTQALAIILTYQLMKKLYEEGNMSDYDLALDIENSAVVISPLIPWNIAGAVPAATLAAGPGFILYANYLYLLPLVYLFTNRKRIKKLEINSQA